MGDYIEKINCHLKIKKNGISRKKGKSKLPAIKMNNQLNYNNSYNDNNQNQNQNDQQQDAERGMGSYNNNSISDNNNTNYSQNQNQTETSYKPLQHQNSQQNFPVYAQQPTKKYTVFRSETPQPDYMSWSKVSLLVCFVWGIFAFISSNKVRQYNRMQSYNQAAYYSQAALRHNRSAVACCVILFLILGVPLAISLAVQGSIYKFPNARMFFG